MILPESANVQLTQSTGNSHSPGAVIARPDFTNAVQGTIEQSEAPLSLAKELDLAVRYCPTGAIRLEG